MLVIQDPKDPDEITKYSVNWAPRLGEDTLATSDFVLTEAAGLTLTDQENTGTTATFWVSGGTSGQTAILTNTVTTAGGEKFEEIVSLAIQANLATTTYPPYTPPTPQDLRARFPRFAGVATEIIQAALDEAARLVDTSWPAADFRNGRLLYAAHVLTMDGQGTGTEAQLNAEGVGDFQAIRLGSLSLSRFAKDSSKSSKSATIAMWDATTYGQRFHALALTAVGAGPLSGGDKTSLAAHANARDVVNLPGLGMRWPGNG